MDEKWRFHGQHNKPRTSSGGRRVKRVRWADEQRTYKPLLLAVLVLNGILLVLGAVSRWGLWANASPPVVRPPSLVHDIQEFDTVRSYPPVASHLAHTWLQLARRQVAPPPANNTPVQTFQVDMPILGQNGRVIGAGTRNGFSGINGTADGGDSPCDITLGVNVFNNSFGAPLVADYAPPACAVGSNTAVMNLTVTSQGRQFDRLAILYLGDVEVFRTSTEEPKAQGISWTYMKDMSQYMTLWKQPQKLIFDLPNAVDPNAKPNPLTATYNTTLTATFFNASQAVEPADTIIPISARQSNNGSQPSVFAIPGESASNVVTDFPRNAARAIFSVSATGQGNEEFWWTNVLQSDVQTYNSSGPKNASGSTLPGFSPFREVQVMIDGQLAGVQWPYPVIFTGGVAPSLWSPMVGIDAFDLKEGEIDISPWLGVLCDGQGHNISINVVGLNDDGKNNATLSRNVGDNWQVTGKIFVWLDNNASSVTKGTPPTMSGLAPTIAVSQTLTQNATGFNDTIRYTTSVQRSLSITGSITTSSGTQAITWSQRLNHTDDGTLSNVGMNQLNAITTQGTDTSTYPGNGFELQYSYPLSANVTTEALSNGTTRLSATLSRTKSVSRSVGPGGGPASPNGLQLFAALPATAGLVGQIGGTSYAATQSGSAVLLMPANGSTTGFGAQSQTLRFGGASAVGVLGDEPDSELYYRDVSVSSSGAVNSDVERIAGQDVVGMRPPATDGS